MFSKSNQAGELMPFTVLWPVKDIKPNESILRDKLAGFDESKFRSSRLRVWFETPDEYYKS
jgi:hypothetical protein